MKKLLPFICIVLCLVSCRDEKDVDPANNATFLRYFGSEHDHTAVLAMEAHDGYTLLSNMDIKVDNLGDFRYKTRLIHTDVYGNTQWAKEFPAFSEATPDTLDGFSASSFLAIDEGYLIIGDRIYKDETNNAKENTQLLLLRLDVNGVVSNSVVLSSSMTGNQKTFLHGRAVTMDAAGDYLILGNIAGHPAYDMYLAKINASTFTLEWSREYGSAEGTVANRLYIGENANIIWGGSVLETSSYDVRLAKAKENSLADSYNSIGDPLRNETIIDFCETLGNYAFVGSIESDQADQDIYFTKITSTATEIDTPEEPFDFDGLNDKAVSITTGVNDGGFMLLGTVETGPTKGNGREDILLLKVDYSGNPEWSLNYGGPDREQGASVRTTSDGSYLVFGTAYFGDLKKLMLMKVSDDGKL